MKKAHTTIGNTLNRADCGYRNGARRTGLRVRTSIKAGIDTVPLPEMPSWKKRASCFIGTWPTPE